MANGDIAVAEAGVVAVKATDDFRLGYDRINEAFDQAVKRGVRSFATIAALNAVTGKFFGDQAVVSGTKTTYQWTGAKWAPWSSPWISYTTTLTGITAIGTNGTQSSYYRWENGLLRVRLDILFGSSPTFSGVWAFTTPINYADDYRVCGPLEVFVSGDLPYTGFVRTRAQNGNVLDLYSNRTDGTFAKGIAVASGQPVTIAQSSVLHCEAQLTAYDYPLGG